MHGPTPKAISRNVRSVKRPRRAPRPVVSTQAMNKLSNVTLSAEQEKLRARFVYKSDWKHPAMFVIQGDAGTGKSVILNSLFNEIQKLSQFSPSSEDILHGTHNYLVVNHPEMLKLYIRISDSFKYISKSSLERPTSLINNLQKRKVMADVVIVDEAHLFYGENHLKDLMSLCKVLVLVYDDKQALRMGSYWDEGSNNGATLKDFYNEIPPKSRDWYTLKQQFRVAAHKTVAGKSHQLNLCYLRAMQIVLTIKLNFDFKIWDDCGAMYEAIKEKDRQYGQCRMLSTYDFPYRLDGKDYYVECGDNFKVRWDRYTPREVTPWSERCDTIDEVGSVYYPRV
ncbi:hypothetical protein GRS66_010907 [Saccharomyces pastorianus]|uniref:Schlafen group 3-like DNA/RNA helicase domain-containing protein n=1 Tax=Saccharomyces pastorianus TaxID=27292 RepID=A0A6C1EFL5_SACPS|nr:hypothetical protein GRS66_010907 [Saccharomyces pastorianus]